MMCGRLGLSLNLFQLVSEQRGRARAVHRTLQSRPRGVVHADESADRLQVGA